jgi:sugar-specific transcriptional regulator TrmB
MKHQNRAELVELGLSPTEAQIYLALVQSAALSASAIATATGLSRTAVYQILCALSDKGLIDSGAGYGTKFAAVAPERALSALIAHDEEALAQRKKVAETLSPRLALLAESTEPAEHVPEEVIQVIRSPRAVADRFDRLQLESERLIQAFCKGAPAFSRPGNPTQEKILLRGVRINTIYEAAFLVHPDVKPYLSKWLAQGEEARVYEGELPHKLAIFDAKIALMPLMMPGEPMKSVIIRHVQLVRTLSLGFELIWGRSKPLSAYRQEASPAEKVEKTLPVRAARDGQLSSRRRKRVNGRI